MRRIKGGRLYAPLPMICLIIISPVFYSLVLKTMVLHQAYPLPTNFSEHWLISRLTVIRCLRPR